MSYRSAVDLLLCFALLLYTISQYWEPFFMVLNTLIDIFLLICIF